MTLWTLLATAVPIVEVLLKFDKIMEIRLLFLRTVDSFEERPATQILSMIFLIILFYVRDIDVSVFQEQDDFCIKVKTRWQQFSN